MKQVTITTILVASILSVGSGRVLAEAPTPNGGCWSREIAVRPIDDLQAMTTIKGRVSAIEQSNNRHIAPKAVAKWLRLKTITGEEKRIYIGSDRYLDRQNLDIQVGDSLEIQGTKMPKAKQATIVARTIFKGDRVWKVNNFKDKPTGTKWCRYSG
jgi:hypothetical protein